MPQQTLQNLPNPTQFHHLGKQNSIITEELCIHQVPLGLLLKNENKTEEMVEILEELHKQYVPISGSTKDTKSVKIVEKVLFGGDQLTEERARNATDGRSDGDSEYERLEGLIPKVEDWHAKRILYQVLQCIVRT